MLRYPDGSLATITYATDGHARFPKETLDLLGGERSARLDNFTKATVWSVSGKDSSRSLLAQDKGQRRMLEQFVAAVRHGTAMPISIPSLIATTRATLKARESLSTGGWVSL